MAVKLFGSWEDLQPNEIILYTTVAVEGNPHEVGYLARIRQKEQRTLDFSSILRLYHDKPRWENVQPAPIDIGEFGRDVTLFTDKYKDRRLYAFGYTENDRRAAYSTLCPRIFAQPTVRIYKIGR